MIMKKYIIHIAAAAFALMGLSACDVETNEKPGGTEVEQMAGFWDVRVHEVNADGTLTPNVFGGSTYNLQTYNTVENTADKMWVNVSVGKQWSLLLVTPINYGTRTFACQNVKAVYNSDDAGATVSITDGKVLEGQGHNLHNMPTDSIVFNVQLSTYPGKTYRVTGTRRSGFTE